jgi:uncharacterized protein YutE (UPF0331/DUF86 family)
VTLNLDLIRARFTDIEQSLARLEQMHALSRERFLSDQDTLDLACYRLQIAMEAAIQICFHVSSQRFQRAPETYADCFAILGREGVLDASLCENLQQMARFRNMLVHVYWEVDYDWVYEILQEHLDDLHAFVKAVGEMI